MTPVNIEGFELQDDPPDEYTQEMLYDADLNAARELFAALGIIKKCQKCGEEIDDIPSGGTLELCRDCDEEQRQEKVLEEILPPIGVKVDIKKQEARSGIRTPKESEICQ